ncbi:hypothetical protein [Novosphingobium terrae]|uniref:hypothetical protein n=1 Tax=Novosphingobium terrae TaxID=2726189 RepID=UPI00197E7BF6|nr:hypothetical protein [Novosphingobium terrae]
MTNINSVTTTPILGLSDRLSNFPLQATKPDPQADLTGSDDTGPPPLQLTVVQPGDFTKTIYDQQMQAAAAVGQDTQSLAEYTAAAFQVIMAKRPDLAHVKFDFVSDQGSVKVVSDALSEKDRQWLEDQLNANSGLVDAMNSYNTDLGKVQALAAKANSENSTAAPLPPTRAIDGSVRFLALLQGVVNAERQVAWSPDETDTDGQGAPIDLASVSTYSLAGMIDAKRQLDALQNGNIISYMKDGRVLYGQRGDDDPYASAGAIGQAFLVDSSSNHALASWGLGQGPAVDRLV